MNERYNNREIDQFLAQQALEHKLLQKSIDEVKEIAERVELQTTKTNGRVDRLENLRWAFAGGFAVLTAIIIPLIAAYLAGLPIHSVK